MSPSYLSSPPPASATNAYDIESNRARGPGRIARRFLARRTKLIVGVIIVSGLILFYTDTVGSTFSPLRHDKIGGVEDWSWKGGFGQPSLDHKDEWEDDGEDYVEPPVRETTYTDEEGNTFFTKYQQDNIAPSHPNISALPSPSSFFPDIDLNNLPPPSYRVFPEDRLREVVSDPPPKPPPAWQAEMAEDAFARNWKGPEIWDTPKGHVEAVQFDFSKRRESANDKEIREERKEAVRRGFAHAWQAYKKHAWGHDEIKPVSKTPSDPFNNWGSSIVDTLDTLLVLGFSDEYNLCRPFVNQLNFHWISGRDWSQGYTSSEPLITGKKDDPPSYASIGRDAMTGLPVFESGIRYLGGLIGAYDLSGDKLLLERAVDIAKVLARAFDTESGLPAGRIDPGSDLAFYRIGQVSLAEVGSMTLELMRLSQLTGDRQWFDLAQRATDYLDQKVVPRSIHPPLLPMWIHHAGPEVPLTGTYTFGAMADSYYEYLIKAYKLLGASSVAEQYSRLYSGSIDQAKNLIYADIDSVPGLDLFTIGQLTGSSLVVETEHLTCFAGAMLGLGARLLDRPDDLSTAERFTQTCYWLSASQASGVQPESTHFYATSAEARENASISGYPVIAPANQAPLDYTKIHRDSRGVLRWNEGKGKVDEDREYVERVKGSPPGVKSVNPRYINRPETIESIFYMYRLTGDTKWQEKGWKMFTSWMTAATVEGGISSIADVSQPAGKLRYFDNMESFMFAETFKYHYLLHAETDVLSLDDYVLNTEAHPFIASSKSSLTPGSQNLWRAPKSQELGVRGQGTDSQKWLRLDVLERALGPKDRSGTNGGGRGGGGGMGGGGGRADIKPNANHW